MTRSRSRRSPTTALAVTARACGLLAVLAVVAVAGGVPALFPSLGPSAYALAANPGAATSQPRRVVGGHVVGVVGGLLAYHALAGGATLVPLPAAGTPEAARLAASAVCSLGVTTAGMLLTDLRHAPACATTLIVSLGLLSTPREAGVVVAAVVVLVGVDRLVPAVAGADPTGSGEV